MDKAAVPGRTGRAFEKACARYNIGEVCKDLMDVFSTLQSLRMEDGFVLDAVLADDEGIGDTSFPYVRKRNGKKYSRKDRNLIYGDPDSGALVLTNGKHVWLDNHIKVEFNPRAIWEAYLLTICWKMLPMWWHANYDRCTFMFSEKSFEGISGGRFASDLDRKSKVLLDIYKTDSSMLPDVSIKDDNTAEISYCFWNDWSGLNRMTVVAHRHGDSVRFSHGRTKNLIRYNCHVCY